MVAARLSVLRVRRKLSAALRTVALVGFGGRFPFRLAFRLAVGGGKDRRRGGEFQLDVPQ